ncbi:MAG: ABC transporter substrate-binding protein [Candidatus Bipolaricaulota bacterium]
MRRTDVLTCLLILVTVLSTSSFATGSFPISVIDDRGETIVIDERPERIVAVNALYAEIIVDLGALDRLIAVADSPDNPEATSGLPSVGPTYAFNVELIVGFEADLVLGATDWGGERPTLESAGITVLTTPLLASVPDIFSSIESIAAAIGSNSEGAKLVGRIAREIVDAEALVLGLPAVAVAFLYAGTPGDPPYAAGAGAIENELIMRAGGTNVFADVEGFPQVSFESILEKDPVVIFTAPSHIGNLLQHPLLQGVSAIRSGRVVGIRASVIASTQVSQGLRAMIEALHGIAP